MTLTGAGKELSYTGLAARDSAGKGLHAWLELQGERLLLKVDDVRARYPLVIDPWVQLAELSASEQAEQFGFSVAISGNTVVVGADYATLGSNQSQGAAFVFVKPSTGWTNMTETAELTASDGANFDEFGVSVGIEGNTVVVGANQAEVGPNGSQGKVYIFVKPAGGWVSMTQSAELTASDGAYADGLGRSVAISGNTIVAGAPGVNGGYGRCYVFVMPAGGWVNGTQTAELSAAYGQYGDVLGSSVAIGGNTVVVGAPGWNNDDQGNALGQGAAYIFVKTANGWVNATENAELVASDGVRGDQLGSSVAISGPTVVAGAYQATVGFNEYQGAAYVFVKPSSGGWIDEYQTAKLTIARGQPAEEVGYSVAISGNTVLAGAPNSPGGGAVYLFTKPASGWANETQRQKLTASQGTAYGGFGVSAALGNSALVVGAPDATVNGNAYYGAAYVFGP